MNAHRPIGIFYEHPDWFRPLFTMLEQRGLPFVRIDAASHAYDPSERTSPLALAFNRASPSSYTRGRRQVTFHTLQWLRHLERIGVPVVNGSKVYAIEISKAAQLEVLEELGIAYPASRVVNHPSQVPAAAQGLRFPLLVKANIGGSGAGIYRFDDADALAAAVRAGKLEFGIDDTALVQEAAPLRGGAITRVEVLGGEILYAIRVFPEAGSFNLCPADACQTAGGEQLTRAACALDAPKNGMRVEAYDAPPEIKRAVLAIAARTGLDVGGIEYLIDDRDGKPYVYDINALSNFVADGPRVVGFDPFARLVDYLERRAWSAHKQEA
jgi:glutathione synthase/RimK-type ligase-like ATP-grasp enzyme